MRYLTNTVCILYLCFLVGCSGNSKVLTILDSIERLNEQQTRKLLELKEFVEQRLSGDDKIKIIERLNDVIDTQKKLYEFLSTLKTEVSGSNKLPVEVQLELVKIIDNTLKILIENETQTKEKRR